MTRKNANDKMSAWINGISKMEINQPELQCAHCGVTFKGSHECDYDRLKHLNQRYKRALENILIEDNFEDSVNQLERIITIVNQALAGDTN